MYTFLHTFKLLSDFTMNIKSELAISITQHLNDLTNVVKQSVMTVRMVLGI